MPTHPSVGSAGKPALVIQIELLVRATKCQSERELPCVSPGHCESSIIGCPIAPGMAGAFAEQVQSSDQRIGEKKQ
jgi:hypothetical protein